VFVTALIVFYSTCVAGFKHCLLVAVCMRDTLMELIIITSAFVCHSQGPLRPLVPSVLYSETSALFAILLYLVVAD